LKLKNGIQTKLTIYTECKEKKPKKKKQEFDENDEGNDNDCDNDDDDVCEDDWILSFLTVFEKKVVAEEAEASSIFQRVSANFKSLNQPRHGGKKA